MWAVLNTEGEKHRLKWVRNYCEDLLQQCERFSWSLFDEIPVFVMWLIFIYSMSNEYWANWDYVDALNNGTCENFINVSSRIITKIGDGWKGYPLKSRYCNGWRYFEDRICDYLVPNPKGFCAQWTFVIEKCESGLINFRILDWCDRWHLRKYEDCKKKKKDKLFKTGDVIDIFVSVKEYKGAIVIKRNGNRYSYYKYQHKWHRQACECGDNWNILYCISVWLLRDGDRVKLDFVRYAWDTTI